MSAIILVSLYMEGLSLYFEDKNWIRNLFEFLQDKNTYFPILGEEFDLFLFSLKSSDS